MQSLKQKIKNTTLLSDEDKIAVLAAIDTYSESDTKTLEVIIDGFDGIHTRSLAEYKKSVFEVLDNITAKQKPDDAPRMQGATAQIKQGVDELLQA